MIHFTHFQTFPKIPEKGQYFQSRDKIPKSESTDSLSMVLRIGHCFVWCVEQNAWIHFSYYMRPVKYSIHM